MFQIPDNVQQHDSSLKKRKKHGKRLSDEKHVSKRVKVSEDDEKEVRLKRDEVTKIELRFSSNDNESEKLNIHGEDDSESQSASEESKAHENIKFGKSGLGTHSVYDQHTTPQKKKDTISVGRA